jgi:hypothetical protein
MTGQLRRIATIDLLIYKRDLMSGSAEFRGDPEHSERRHLLEDGQLGLLRVDSQDVHVAMLPKTARFLGWKCEKTSIAGSAARPQ